MRIENAELRNINIQERTFTFARRIVKLYTFLVKQGGAGKVLASQILRSGTSIAANLEEADAGESKADFIHKCNIALKEARETHFWLRLFEAEVIISPKRIADLIQECNEIIAIITTIIKNSKQKA